MSLGSPLLWAGLALGALVVGVLVVGALLTDRAIRRDFPDLFR